MISQKVESLDLGLLTEKKAFVLASVHEDGRRKKAGFFVFGILNNVAYSQVLATEQVDTDSEQVTWDKELCFKTARLPLSGIIQVGSSDVYIDILQDTLPDNFTPTEESLEGVEWKPQLVAAKVLEIEEHTYGH